MIKPITPQKQQQSEWPVKKETYDRPCRFALGPADMPLAPPPIGSDHRRPSAAKLRHRNCPLADRTGPRPACEKSLGTTNTVLCYRLTLRKPLLLRKH